MTTIHRVGSITVAKQGHQEYSITNDFLVRGTLETLGISFKTQDNVLIFSAESVQTLDQLLGHVKTLDYQQTLYALHTLGKQLVYLEELNKGVLFYNLDNILVINQNTFLFIDLSHILPIDREGYMTLNIPLTPNPNFMAPELLKANALPLRVFYKSSYYSLGLVLIFCLLGENKYDDSQQLETLLNPIYTTKLYYFFLRALHQVPKKRTIIYI